MMIGVKGKQLYNINNFQLSMHCDLDLWTPKKNRAHPRLMGGPCMKFHDDRCKGKAIMRHKPFSVITALCPWPLTFWPKIHSAHPQLMGSLCMKIHDDRWNGKAIMQHKTFSVINGFWPWPLTFWPQNPLGLSLTHGVSLYEVSGWQA